jgi:hypothetical protein
LDTKVPRIGFFDSLAIYHLFPILQESHDLIFIYSPAIPDFYRDCRKTLQCSQWVVFGGLMAPHNYEIVDCSAFCEVIFFCISPKNLLGDFFDSLTSNPQSKMLSLSDTCR